jgi:hypothetical protein
MVRIQRDKRPKGGNIVDNNQARQVFDADILAADIRDALFKQGRPKDAFDAGFMFGSASAALACLNAAVRYGMSGADKPDAIQHRKEKEKEYDAGFEVGFNTPIPSFIKRQ